MANIIRWAPSTDPDILKYDVYSGPTSTGSWTFLSGIVHDLSGSSYSSGTFFYNDLSGTSGSWYRLDAIDTFAQTGSSYFQASSTPSSVYAGNKISWYPSEDPAVDNRGTYIIEAASTTNGPWAQVAQISAVRAGTYWNSSVEKFVYGDTTHPYNTWYRVIHVDYTGARARPSDVILPDPMPYFTPGSTPFGIYDNDPQFIADADKVVEFVKKKLGDPVMQVHAVNSQIYAAFEEACLEYSAMVNSYQAKSVLTSFLGSPTGTLTGGENRYVNKNIQFELYQADAFAAEAKLNSMQPWYTASITLNGGQQTYDLQALLSGTGPLTGSYDRMRVRVRDIYHYSPMQAYRFFGTTSGLNYLNNQFKFESFTPETLFYLLPIWEDVLRGMQFKTSNTVRRSNYSFAMHNNNLSIYPCPTDTRQLWLTYTVDNNPVPSSTGVSPSIPIQGTNAVSNLSNIPFGNIPYSGINSISKHWIRRMALALAKEIEGQIRSKFSTVPIPNGDVTLNGPELISDGRAEQEFLRAELKDLLEETTYQNLMRKEQEMAAHLQDTLKGVPMGIFVG